MRGGTVWEVNLVYRLTGVEMRARRWVLMSGRAMRRLRANDRAARAAISAFTRERVRHGLKAVTGLRVLTATPIAGIDAVLR